MTTSEPEIVHEDGPYTVTETRLGRFEVHLDGVTVATRLAVVALPSRQDSLAACRHIIARHKCRPS